MANLDSELEVLFEKFRKLNALETEALAAEAAHARSAAKISRDLERAREAAFEKAWAVEQQIISTPAQSLRGLALKVAAYEMGGGAEAMQASILADIRRLAAE